MKTVKLALAAYLASGRVMYAQETKTPKFEVGLEYSWLHVNSANFDFQRTGNGGSGYLEYNINSMFRLVGDFGGYANTRTGINDKALTYLFGPRFTWRHSRFNPYVQFLFGGAYAWSGPTDNSQKQNAFATAAGGGLDINLTEHVSIKPIQVEYLMTQFDSPDWVVRRRHLAVTRMTFAIPRASYLSSVAGRTPFALQPPSRSLRHLSD